jgi:competence protein ComEA
VPSVGEVADTEAPVVVSVVGLVARPGLVTLPPGSRVADAVKAAGGLLPEADPAMINLAALVTDGQQIAVGVPGAAAAATGSGGAGGASVAGSKLDLNAATVADLDGLPGIGPVLAQRIVDFRTTQGPFRSVDDLDDVPGIGPAVFGELVDLVVVTAG